MQYCITAVQLRCLAESGAAVSRELSFAILWLLYSALVLCLLFFAGYAAVAPGSCCCLLLHVDNTIYSACYIQCYKQCMLNDMRYTKHSADYGVIALRGNLTLKSCNCLKVCAMEASCIEWSVL